MDYDYFICDVFTDRQFGGNQLAVFPDAIGLTDLQMQQVAREFNFAETTFVLPAEAGHTRRVRIFTPSREVPFAGHPNLGTAFILVSQGLAGIANQASILEFEEDAGLVSVSVKPGADGLLNCELTAPQPVSLGQLVAVDLVARALSIEPEDIVCSNHLPRLASVGLPFLMVELRDRAALERSRVNAGGFDEIAGLGITPDIHLYVRSDDEFDIRARMFAPHDGVPEDAATGSANCALAGLLASIHAANDGKFDWKIAQGVEMGRPSLLIASASKENGEVSSVRIAGTCTLFASGKAFVG